MIRDDRNPRDPGDIEDRRGPLPPSQIRVAPATREGWVAVTIREAPAVQGRSPTKTFVVYFVPYSLFKGTDLAAADGWRKLEGALAGCEIVATFVARGVGGEQTTWVAQTWQQAGWYVGRGVNASGVQSIITAPFPSPWNPLSDGGLYWGPDSGRPDTYPPDVTDPEVLCQATRDENYGGPVLRLRVSADIPVPLGTFGAFQLYIENYQNSGNYAEWLTVNRGTQEAGTLTAYFVITPDAPSSASNFTEIEKIAASPGYANSYKVTSAAGAISTRTVQGSTGRIALWNYATKTVTVVTVAYGQRISSTLWYLHSNTVEGSPVGTKWHPESNQPLTENYAYVYTQRKLLGTYNQQPHLVKVYFVSISERGLRRDDWESSPCVWFPFGLRSDMNMPTQVRMFDLNKSPTMSGLLLTWQVTPTAGELDDTVDHFIIYRRRAGCDKLVDLDWVTDIVVPDHTFQYQTLPASKLLGPTGEYQWLDRNFNIDASVDPSTAGTGFDFDPANPGWYEYVVTSVSPTGFENRSFHPGQVDPERNHNYGSVLGETQQTDAGPDRDTTHNRLFNTAFLTVPYQSKVDGLPIAILYGQAIDSPEPVLTLPGLGFAGLYTFGYYYSLEAYVAPRLVDGSLNPWYWEEPSGDKVNWVGSGTWSAPVPSDPRAREFITSEAIYPKWDPRAYVNPYGKMLFNAALATAVKRVLKDDDIYWGWQTAVADAIGGGSSEYWYPTLQIYSGSEMTIEPPGGPPAYYGSTSWVVAYGAAFSKIWRSAAFGSAKSFAMANWNMNVYCKVATASPPVYVTCSVGVLDTSANRFIELAYVSGTAVSNTDYVFLPFRMLGDGTFSADAADYLRMVMTFWVTSGSNTLYLYMGYRGDTGSTYSRLDNPTGVGGAALPAYLAINNTGTRGISSGEVLLAITGTERSVVQLVRRDRFYPGENLILGCDFSVRADGVSDEVTVPSKDASLRDNAGKLVMWMSRIDMNRYTVADDGIAGPDTLFQRGVERDSWVVSWPFTTLSPVSVGSKRNWFRLFGSMRVPDNLVQFTNNGAPCKGAGWAKPSSPTYTYPARMVRLLSGTGPAVDDATSLVMSVLQVTQGSTTEKHLIRKLYLYNNSGTWVWDIELKDDLTVSIGPGACTYVVIPAFTHYAFGFGRRLGPPPAVNFFKVGSSYVYNDAIVIRRPMVNGGKVGVPWTNELYYAQAPGQDFEGESPGGGYTPPPTGSSGGDPSPGGGEGPPNRACVTGETPILLADGTTKPAQLIRPGLRLAAVSNGRPTVTKVEEIVVNRVGKVYVVTDAEGNAVSCSESHRFATRGERLLVWRKAKDVRPGDRLVALDGGGVVHLTEVLAVTERATSATVYTFVCSPHHNYVAGVFISHNKISKQQA